MNRPILYLAITNHGFGHAVRSASIANHIQKLNPDILLVVVTTAPRWLLESYIEGDFIYRYKSFDVGVIQSDSLNMDLTATLTTMENYYQREAEIIAGEVEYITLNQVDLVLADIPAMAVKIAHQAGIPCWMMSNFGWDFIYRDWGNEFETIVNWLSDCYNECDRLFRLPLSEPMDSFPHQEDVGLTGGIPRYSEDELREKYNITAVKEKIVLLTFGGLGLTAIPYENIRDFPDWQFITFATNAPDMSNLIKIKEQKERPVDIMLICGQVFSKPGFSTFAESMRLDVPVTSLTRDGFAEANILLDGLCNHSYHRIIHYQDFFNDNWDFLKQDLIPPLTNKKLDKFGGEFIAQEVVNFFAQ
jgi:hypothetical protein